MNVESLQEYRYFTFVHSSSKRILLQKPTNYWLDYNDGLLTLNFTLPLKTPVSAQTLSLEFYDPVGFIDFTLSERNAIKLFGAPASCKLNIRKPDAGPSTSTLSEEFFNSLTEVRVESTALVRALSRFVRQGTCMVSRTSFAAG